MYCRKSHDFLCPPYMSTPKPFTACTAPHGKAHLEQAWLWEATAASGNFFCALEPVFTPHGFRNLFSNLRSEHKTYSYAGLQAEESPLFQSRSRSIRAACAVGVSRLLSPKPRWNLRVRLHKDIFLHKVIPAWGIDQKSGAISSLPFALCSLCYPSPSCHCHPLPAALQQMLLLGLHRSLSLQEYLL